MISAWFHGSKLNQVGQISEGLSRLPASATWCFPAQRSKNCQNFPDFLYEKKCSKSNGNSWDCSQIDNSNMFKLSGEQLVFPVRNIPYSLTSIVSPVWCWRLTMAEMTLQGLQVCEMWPWLQSNLAIWDKGLKDLKVGKGNLLVDRKTTSAPKKSWSAEIPEPLGLFFYLYLLAILKSARNCLCDLASFLNSVGQILNRVGWVETRKERYLV